MVENITAGASARNVRVVLFDFDGTLSLIRSGWMNVMVPMMVEILIDLKSGETEDQLRAVVEEFVWKLTGKEKSDSVEKRRSRKPEMVRPEPAQMIHPKDNPVSLPSLYVR